MKIDKQTLGLAAEYALASELCRRDIYAQLTLGYHKRADILAETENSMLKIQVKAKQGREWPGVRGISGTNVILVLVDYKKKDQFERPDFYILNEKDWNDFLNKKLKENKNSLNLDDNGVPMWSDGYRGIGIKIEDIEKYKERWDEFEGKIKR